MTMREKIGAMGGKTTTNWYTVIILIGASITNIISLRPGSFGTVAQTRAVAVVEAGFAEPVPVGLAKLQREGAQTRP